MIKKYKPTSPGRRAQTKVVGSKTNKRNVSKKTLRELTVSLRGAVGRSHGRISVQHRFAGAKRRYRVIDFKRDKKDVIGFVESIDYDPNRTCEIALIKYVDGDRRYILAPNGLKVGNKILASEITEPLVGCSIPMKNIPLGLQVHNIELYPLAGGKFVRSAGAAAVITAKEGKYVLVKMPSGEVRRFLGECYATIGQVGLDDWKLMSFGKAGRRYHLGVRPTTRGKARSDGHPLGGSYSQAMGRQPVDKWGNLSKGKKTRKRKYTSKYIVKDRRSK